MSTVLLINGASGTGKTTTAAALGDAIGEALWIHPDALWDTPNMSPQAILMRAIDQIVGEPIPRLAIVDCQARATTVREVLTRFPSLVWINVLLTCPRAVREQRLLRRGWDQSDFPRVETWASLLLSDAADAGDLIADTSIESTPVICTRIIERLGKMSTSRGRQ